MKPRTIAVASVALGITVVAAAAWSSRRIALEHYYLWKLKSADPSVRRTAVSELGRMKAARAVPHLVELLKSADIDAKLAAHLALVEIGSAAIPYLIEAVEDQYGEVRSSAIEICGQMGREGAAAIPFLVKMLNRTGESPQASRALARIGPQAIEAIVDALEHEDPFFRANAAFVLGQMEAPANEIVPHLIELLSDEQGSVRNAAAYALRRVGPAAQAAVPVLRERLKDEVKVVRSQAEEALKRINSRSF